MAGVAAGGGVSCGKAPRPGVEADRAAPLAQDYTVVLHNPAGGRGLDGPGIVRMPGGRLVVVVPMSPGGGKWLCRVLQSTDRGRTWQAVSELPYYSAVPWLHEGMLYLFAHPEGTKFRNDDLILLRSTDSGATWSDPVTLFPGHYWNCQTGMAIRDHRLYWAIDDLSLGMPKRGPRVVAGDLSRELMDPRAWRLSNMVPFPGLPESLVHPKFSGSYPSTPMLEPNVILVNGQLRVLAAVKPVRQSTTNLCAVFDVTDDGRMLQLSFTQFHPMPGGQVKFCILWDDVSRLFWATVNLAADGQDVYGFQADPPEKRGGRPYSGAIGGNDRRFLMLMYGLDGLNWFPAGCVARAGKLSQSFMYASQAADGDDLAIVARSSVHSENRHDADYATFHRVRDFRKLAMNLRPDGNA
jgi:hypothetical protein